MSRSISRLFSPVLIASALAFVVATGCASDVPSTAVPTTAVVDATAVDTISPLIITAVAPDPTPFRGSDDRFHVAYELTVLNFAPAPATITALDTVAPDGALVRSLDQQDVADRMMIVADYSGAQPANGDALQIPSGKTAIIVIDDVYRTGSDIPDSVSHRIAATFGRPESGEGGIAELWPRQVSQLGGEIAIADGAAVQIGAPLAGPGWVIDNGCCTLNAHRNVVLPVDGRINGAERFAIDASRIDVAAVAAGSPGDPYVDGDPTRNESNRSYGAPVLAVADATVVAVTADVPDTEPGSLPLGPGFTLANLGGNSVVLELAPDLYGVYYHLAPGSPTVRIGDRVRKGDVIATLGNSGNSSAAHLHFQLSRSPLIFSSDSVPFVIDRFTVVGSLDPATDRLLPQPATGLREAELPMATDVIDFP
jgi:hypothetical protein